MVREARGAKPSEITKPGAAYFIINSSTKYFKAIKAMTMAARKSAIKSIRHAPTKPSSELFGSSSQRQPTAICSPSR